MIHIIIINDVAFIGRSTLVGQRPMKSLSSVWTSICPSIRPSIRPSVRSSFRLSVRRFVRPSLSFLTIGSLLFSGIVHNDSWPWSIISNGWRSQIFEKKKKKKLVILSFLPFFWSCIISFLWCWTRLEIGTMCKTDVKPQKKNKKTKKKPKNYGLNWGRSDLFYSNVAERPLKLACF